MFAPPQLRYSRRFLCLCMCVWRQCHQNGKYLLYRIYKTEEKNNNKTCVRISFPLYAIHINGPFSDFHFSVVSIAAAVIVFAAFLNCNLLFPCRFANDIAIIGFRRYYFNSSELWMCLCECTVKTFAHSLSNSLWFCLSTWLLLFWKLVFKQVWNLIYRFNKELKEKNRLNGRKLLWLRVVQYGISDLAIFHRGWNNSLQRRRW